jgi:hypothetical protein
MDPPHDARTPKVRGVEADDRRRRLAQGDPEAPAVRAEVEVMSLRSHEHMPDDPVPVQIDHDQPAASPVCDVGVAVSGCDCGYFGLAKAVEDLDRRERVPGEERHDAVRVDDHGRAVEGRGDHQRIVEPDPLEHMAALPAEGDGEELVRGLGDDERDWAAPGGSRGRRGRQQEGEGEEREGDELAHACDTPESCRAVPGELRLCTLRGVAQPG